MIKRLVLLFCVVFILSCESENESISFIILQMNDVYEISPLEGGEVGGLARVATLRKQLRFENPNVITVLAGDFISPSLIGTLKYEGEKIAGKQMIEVLNELELDYVTFGNHEFDVKEEELQARINESEFEWISSNTYQVNNGNRSAFQKDRNGRRPLPQFLSHRVGNSQGDSINIGFFGVTLDFNKKDYVAYDDYRDAAQSILKKYKSSYDLPIAISHLEKDQDAALAKVIPEVPLILGGHDHTNMNFKVGATQISKADANAKTVYIHRCTYDEKTKTLLIDSELKVIDSKLALDPPTQKMVDKWEKIANQSMNAMGYQPNEVVTKTSEMLDGREASIRNRPTNLGRMSAQAMFSMDSTLDFALLNSGSIRLDDQLTGSITQYDILRTFPFGGHIVITTLKGNIVKKILEIGLLENRGIGGYMQAANIYFGSKNEFVIGEEIIDEEKEYKLILPKFVMDGGEANLEFLTEYSYDDPASFKNGKVRNDIRDVLIEYLQSTRSPF